MKKRIFTLILLVIALTAMPGQLLAAADLTTGVLTVTGTTNIDEIQLQVGPTPGEVVILKAPGVVDGTRFSGVQSIVVISGNSFSDKVEIKAELTSDLAITVDTGRGGDEMKMDMKALAGNVNVRVDVIGSTGENKLEWLVDSDAQALGLTLAANSDAGVDTLVLKVNADSPSARLGLNLAAATGTSDDKIEAVIKSAAAVVDLNLAANTEIGSDSIKVELEQIVPGNVTANLNLDLSGSDDSGEIILKGSSATFAVNGLVSAGQGNDAVKLFVEGSASGAPIIDGGFGQDSCSVSFGRLVACE